MRNTLIYIHTVTPNRASNTIKTQGNGIGCDARLPETCEQKHIAKYCPRRKGQFKRECSLTFFTEGNKRGSVNNKRGSVTQSATDGRATNRWGENDG